MTLTVIVRAHRDGERAGLVEAQLRMLDEARVRGFHGAGDAEPAQLAVLGRFPQALLEAFVVRHHEAVFEVLAEVAAVVGVDQRGLERHRLLRDHVAAPQLRGIDAELARGEVDQRLQDIGGFRPAGAAIRAGEHGVGEGAVHLDVAGRECVGARQHADIVGRRTASAVGGIVGADVAVVLHADGEELAVLVECELGLGDVVAAVLVGEERLRCGRRSISPAAR